MPVGIPRPTDLPGVAGWLARKADPANESVTDSTLTNVIQMLARAMGANDPAGQMMGIMTTGIPSAGPPGGVVGQVGKAKDAFTEAYQRALHPSGFYSRVDEAAQMIPDKGVPAQALVNRLRKAPGGVAQEELDLRKLQDLVGQSGNRPITRAELKAWLEAHPAPFPEVKTRGVSTSPPYKDLNDVAERLFQVPYDQLDSADKAAAQSELFNPQIRRDVPTKYAQYQVPGGEHYRETLLTLPPPKTLGFKVEQQAAEGFPKQYAINFADKDRPGSGITGYVTDFSGERRFGAPPDPSKPWKATFQNTTQWFDNPDSGAKWVQDRMRAIEGNIAAHDSGFRSSHFDEPNILVHTRSNERTLPTGERGRFLEEVQSDWHQAGKAKGYGPTYEYRAFYKTPRGMEVPLGYGKTESEAMANIDPGWKNVPLPGEIQVTRSQVDAGVPDAPFKDTWPDLGLKQQLIEAARSPETSWLGTTSGKTQAARYDLSKQIKTLRVERIGGPGEPLYVMNAQQHGGRPQVDLGSHEAKDLPSVIGKEMAERIANNPDKTQIYSGLDLQVGGEGMHKFYDELIPKRLEKIVKPFGGTVERGAVRATTQDMAVDVPAFSVRDQDGFMRGIWQNRADAEAYLRNPPSFIDPTRSTIVPATTVNYTGREIGEPAWIARLSPQMKERIKREGLPLLAAIAMLKDQVQPQPSHETFK